MTTPEESLRGHVEFLERKLERQQLQLDALLGYVAAQGVRDLESLLLDHVDNINLSSRLYVLRNEIQSIVT